MRPWEDKGSGEMYFRRQPDTRPPGMWEGEGGGKKALHQVGIAGAPATASEGRHREPELSASPSSLLRAEHERLPGQRGRLQDALTAPSPHPDPALPSAHRQPSKDVSQSGAGWRAAWRRGCCSRGTGPLPAPAPPAFRPLSPWAPSGSGRTVHRGGRTRYLPVGLFISFCTCPAGGDAGPRLLTLRGGQALSR